MSLKRVAILGGGNMGGSIARGMVQNADLGIAPDQIVIAETDAAKHASLKRGIGCEVVPAAAEAMRVLDPAGIVLVAVKPQMFPQLALSVGSEVGRRLVITVMAGQPAARVHQNLGGQCRVARVMPNLPLVVGQGMTAMCAGPGALPADTGFVMKLFSKLGRCIELDESLMDAMTAVASSGAAYVFYLAESMIRGAVAVGFEKETATEIVRQTILGASTLLAEDPAGPEELRARVTSRGGTTAAATAVLDTALVQDVVQRAVIAARDRGRELASS